MREHSAVPTLSTHEASSPTPSPPPIVQQKSPSASPYPEFQVYGMWINLYMWIFTYNYMTTVNVRGLYFFVCFSVLMFLQLALAQEVVSYLYWNYVTLTMII